MADDKTRIVILGGGFAGAYCAKKLERLLRHSNTEITLINKENNFVFTPMLVEAATSALEPRHVVIPLRGFLTHTGFIMADIDEIDLANKIVFAKPAFGDCIKVPYDHLVFALGSVTHFPDIDGVEQYAYGLKSLADAMILRDRAIGMLEMANNFPQHEQRKSWLTFAVVGAGYTGVEAAGEFHAFLTEASRQYHKIDAKDIHVLLIQRGERILDSLDETMSEKASKILIERGVDIRLKNGIEKLEENCFTLKSGERVESHTVIWSAGVSSPPLIKGLDLPTNSHGYLDCQPDLRIKGYDNIWAIGDCASNPDPSGHPYPPTAQHALQEGRHAAKNIAALLKGDEPKPLVYHSKGTTAPLGGRQAIANIYGTHLTGLLAWFIWRTIYLGIMPGFGRKIRVAMDWTTDMFFQRDYSQQGYQNKP